MPHAARKGDPIGHSPAMSWLVKGLLVGAAVGVAAVAVIGTGGLAAAAIVGGLAAGGAGVGELLSSMSWAPKEVCGMIITGSSDIFINNRPAARAHVDRTICSKHSGTPPIATGSATVIFNNMPAARVDDKISCGAVIVEGSPDVIIEGGTVQTDTIQPENLVPAWVHWSLLAVGVGAAVVLGGPIVGALGIAGGLGGGWLGGKIFGEGSDGQKWMMLGGSILGGTVGVKGGMVLANKAIPAPITQTQGFLKGGVPGLKEAAGNRYLFEQCKGARGAISGREFDPSKAGGKILALNNDNIKINSKGIDAVEQHVSRFGPDKANVKMVQRLRDIEAGKIEATKTDINFYSHELRESVRYRKLGWPKGQPNSVDDAYEVWNNAHTATLEDYGLKEGPGVLYHPDTIGGF